MINIKGIHPAKELFHNVKIDVYHTETSLEEIHYWQRNLRTLLSLELLQKEYRKKLSEIPLDDVVDYLAKQRGLAISELAKSIEKNGVRVPLIILKDKDDIRLLDGNRRYFACHYLRKQCEKEGRPRPTVLDAIPVWVIRNDDIDYKMEQKILAEANFVPQYKVEWTLDVKAKVVYDYFRSCRKEGVIQEEVYEEILDVYGVKRQVVDDYVDSVKITKQFIKFALRKERDRRREIVQDKFVYFWEFRNKAYVQTIALDEKEIAKVKKLFFTMMANDRFKNMKQIEPMILAVRDMYAWKILDDSSGSKIDQIEAMYKEERAIKRTEDKIRNFRRWLKKIDPIDISKTSIRLLRKLIKECRDIVKSRKKG